jgi:hypothetical protein
MPLSAYILGRRHEQQCSDISSRWCSPLCSNRAATRVNLLKCWERCQGKKSVHLQEFCKLQKSAANYLSAFTRQRSLVRTQHRPHQKSSDLQGKSLVLFDVLKITSTSVAREGWVVSALVVVQIVLSATTIGAFAFMLSSLWATLRLTFVGVPESTPEEDQAEESTDVHS